LFKGADSSVQEGCVCPNCGYRLVPKRTATTADVHELEAENARLRQSAESFGRLAERLAELVGRMRQEREILTGEREPSKAEPAGPLTGEAPTKEQS
jgi:hypothetical protein